ncbi:MAG: carboxypeptidase regulatory-like domain-containing protein [Gemmatimonadaceae bacterium]
MPTHARSRLRATCRALIRSGALALACAAIVRPLGAQGDSTGRLEGSITDSVRAMPLGGATVSISMLGAVQESTLVATTTEDGRFSFENLRAGDYAVSFSSAFLDSIEFGGAATRLAVRSGEVARVHLAAPSGATLRSMACPGMTLSRGTGALLGLVMNADTDRPILGAQVAAMWTELSFDGGLRSVSTAERSGGVRTDSLGQYRLCGVPTDSWLLVQVQDGDRLGAALQLLVPEASGVLMQHLSVSESGTRTLAALLAAQQHSAALAPLSGSAGIAGIILSSRGGPVANALVRVVSTAPVARTNEVGQFTLTGLPAGTQELEIRELGSQVQRRPVDLRAGRTARATIQLKNVFVLEPVRTVSARAKYDRFETNRRTSLTGLFLNQEDIERRHVLQVSDLFGSMVSFVIVGQGPSARVVNLRGRCSPNVVIEYRENQDINSVPPSLVAAIEVYPTTNGAPAEFTNLCGVVRIWLKR